MGTATLDSTKTGRPKSIPPEAYAEVFKLLSQGLGYRAIADALAERQLCYTTKSSVERMVKGQPPYQGRRVVRARLNGQIKAPYELKE